ncbi:Ig-like domain-containing protein [Plantactinospora solaniradicis]|uniref:Ig-like domain-containing protein n=1 Tax=Plantactinospora solaniradicis TaxID=1723736 RepID=A0ABW1KKT2_9ACTN
MRSVRLTTAAVLAVIIAGLTWPAPTARAGGPGETVYGDFNGDDILDAVQLGAVSPNYCSSIVQYGTVSGTLLPPIAFIYLQPGGDPSENCPDMGVAADFNEDGTDDLGVGWSNPPAGLDYNRLILYPPNFQPSFRYLSVITHPTYFGTGVFSPGAPPTPYAIGPGGIANSIIQGNTVVTGPIRYCSLDTPTAQLADWTQTGVDGVLLAYTRGCADASNGVVRIRPDGSVQQIEIDPAGRTRWTARVVNANGDRFPDARTVNQTTGQVSYFINTGSDGMFLLVRSPRANTDRVTLGTVRPLAIDVLGNDYVSRYGTVTITSPPRYGTVQVLSDRRILYRPNPRHGRTDRFTYQLTDEGRRSNATVTIGFPA